VMKENFTRSEIINADYLSHLKSHFTLSSHKVTYFTGEMIFWSVNLVCDKYHLYLNFSYKMLSVGTLKSRIKLQKI